MDKAALLLPLAAESLVSFLPVLLVVSLSLFDDPFSFCVFLLSDVGVTFATLEPFLIFVGQHWYGSYEDLGTSCFPPSPMKKQPSPAAKLNGDENTLKNQFKG